MILLKNEVVCTFTHIKNQKCVHIRQTAACYCEIYTTASRKAPFILHCSTAINFPVRRTPEYVHQSSTSQAKHCKEAEREFILFFQIETSFCGHHCLLVRKKTLFNNNRGGIKLKLATAFALWVSSLKRCLRNSSNLGSSVFSLRRAPNKLPERFAAGPHDPMVSNPIELKTKRSD